jgi:hypothetical protein
MNSRACECVKEDGGCGRLFGGERTFDDHQRGRKCKSTRELRAMGLHLVDGVWIRDGLPRQERLLFKTSPRMSANGIRQSSGRERENPRVTNLRGSTGRRIAKTNTAVA